MLLKLVCIVVLCIYTVSANVIGLDFGSDAMKIAIVQPGTPLEIVANFQSKRKTPTSISFYRNERLFGSDSTALQARKPEVTYSKMYRALGRVEGHKHIDEIIKEQYFPHSIYTNESTGFTNIAHEDTTYTPEEIIAMMLQHAKDMTLNFGGKQIKDCVVTVPSYFTQHEKRALYTAASIADLNVLTLLEENTAAALHYGIDRVFDEPTTVLYYNFGAGSVQVTIVTYSSYVAKEAGKNKTIGQFEVVGKAWDSSLGGFNFDVKLAELLAGRFNEAWSKKAHGKGKDLHDFTRPMTRLRIEANKVKEVLSANMEYPVKIEQLHADVDLVTKVTRAEFEAACEDLFKRMTLPIDQALAMANMRLEDIKSVELLGGVVRTPKVKKVLEEYFKPSKLDLGQHLNGDEAMALGAAFRAANMSTAFRVRKVGISDISSFGVSIALETLPVAEVEGGILSNILDSVFAKPADSSEGSDAAAAAVWSKNVELFPKKSAVPSKTKTVTFAYDKDILCRIAYTDESLLLSGTGPLIGQFNITGVAAFAKETAVSHPTAGPPRVHLSFSLGDDGMVSLLRAEVTADLPLELDTDAGKIESADSSANETSSSATNETATADSNATDSKSASDKKKASSKKDSKSKKDNVVRKSLVIVEETTAVKPAAWTMEHIAEARARLAALQAADDARKAKEAALNDLEAYVYKVKNLLSDEEDNWKKVSTDEQRQEVIDLANAAEEWIYDDGRNAAVADYKAKQLEVKKKAEAIFNRFSELSARPAAVTKAQNVLRTAKAKAETWSVPGSHITDKEVEQLTAAIKKVEEWLEAKQELQLAKADHEKPAFDSDGVKAQIETVVSIYKKLSDKPVPVPKKVSSNETNTNSTAAASEEDDGVVKVNVTVDEKAEVKTEEQPTTAEAEL